MFRTTILLVISGLLAGCSIPRGIVWLSDCSGFVYMSRDGSLVKYDVNEQTKTVLLSEVSRSTRVPAVSPDGRHFAVVNAFSVPIEGVPHSEDSIQVVVYDGDGRSTGKSQVLIWESDDEELEGKTVRNSAAIWSPRGDRILVCAMGGSKSRYAWYDVKTQKLHKIENARPVVYYDWVYRLSPIRPDGKGFLAMPDGKRTDGFSDLMFVEWNGRQHELKETASVKEFEAALEKARSEARKPGIEVKQREGEKLFPLPDGFWKGGTATIVCEGHFHIDTDNQTLSYEADEDLARRRRQLAEEDVYEEVKLAGGRFVVRLRGTDGTPNQSSGGDRFELRDTTTGKTTFLTGFVELGFERPMTVSPDKQYVVLKYSPKRRNREKEEEQEYVMVIDSDGRVVTKFQLK